MKAAYRCVTSLPQHQPSRMLIAALLLSAATTHAASKYDINHSGTAIGDDVLYSIGGGSATTMGGAASMDLSLIHI